MTMTVAAVRMRHADGAYGSRSRLRSMKLWRACESAPLPRSLRLQQRPNPVRPRRPRGRCCGERCRPLRNGRRTRYIRLRRWSFRFVEKAPIVSVRCVFYDIPLITTAGRALERWLGWRARRRSGWPSRAAALTRETHRARRRAMFSTASSKLGSARSRGRGCGIRRACCRADAGHDGRTGRA